ncbi:uncharacterized protein LOC132628643 [Lycium barbarum]|uniref:uncharacterized protein LOC132628643 n=1 Tax=Lycium barbarum TaxID=112863 RepID=UPI00293F450E|nr:uncharacterized protein LOC132628643 [Lycium barbarum]
MGQVVELRRVNDRIMAIKLIVGGSTLNIVITYAPQIGLDEEEKNHFWDVLDKVLRAIPLAEKLFIGGDFNGHIGSIPQGYDDAHGGFGFSDMNVGVVLLLDFSRALGLVVANSSFPKREEQLVTFSSSRAKTQIDYFLLRKDDKELCKDCKDILRTQHKLLAMDLEIKKKKKKRL